MYTNLESDPEPEYIAVPVPLRQEVAVPGPLQTLLQLQRDDSGPQLEREKLEDVMDCHWTSLLQGHPSTGKQR
jgi:hypothetical protein